MSRPRVVIVGAGPAGLGALEVLCERGVELTLVDEGSGLGGQGWHPRTTPVDETLGAAASRELGERARARIEALGSAFEHRAEHQAIALYPGPELLVEHRGRVESLRPAAVLLATGAHDRILPFPGWTTPGVLGLGGLLNLIERHEFAPTGPVVLAGAGPLLLLAAVRLVELGRPPAAVLDCAGLFDLASALPGLLGARSLLAEGRAMLAVLRRAGVRVRRRWTVVEALGDGRVDGVRVAPVDAHWRPRLAEAVELEASLLAVGHGLAPEVALAAGAGVELRWDNAAGGWCAVHADDHSTSVRALWVAGDGCGVHGAELAWLQGARAGLSIAHELGASMADEGQTIQGLSSRLRATQRARAGLEKAMAPRPGLLQAVPDETVVCRCEGVTVGELRGWADRGATGITGLKMATRAGMGRCQGRFCAGSVRALLEGWGVAESGEPPSPRPPARPVSLGALEAWQR